MGRKLLPRVKNSARAATKSTATEPTTILGLRNAAASEREYTRLSHAAVRGSCDSDEFRR